MNIDRLSFKVKLPVKQKKRTRQRLGGRMIPLGGESLSV